MRASIPYLRVFKNPSNAFYTHTVIKGDELYELDLHKDQKLRWRYKGRIDPKIYQPPGTLVSKPSLKTIYIIQKILQPPVKESLEIRAKRVDEI